MAALSADKVKLKNLQTICRNSEKSGNFFEATKASLNISVIIKRHIESATGIPELFLFVTFYLENNESREKTVKLKKLFNYYRTYSSQCLKKAREQAQSNREQNETCRFSEQSPPPLPPTQSKDTVKASVSDKTAREPSSIDDENEKNKKMFRGIQPSLYEKKT